MKKIGHLSFKNWYSKLDKIIFKCRNIIFKKEKFNYQKVENRIGISRLRNMGGFQNRYISYF